MYNTLCELRDTLSRDGDDEAEESTATGTLIAKFFAKVIRTTVMTGQAGDGTASNDTAITLMAPYFKEEIIPTAHTIVINGKGYIIAEATTIGKKIRIRLQ